MTSLFVVLGFGGILKLVLTIALYGPSGLSGQSALCGLTFVPVQCVYVLIETISIR